MAARSKKTQNNWLDKAWSVYETHFLSQNAKMDEVKASLKRVFEDLGKPAKSEGGAQDILLSGRELAAIILAHAELNPSASQLRFRKLVLTSKSEVDLTKASLNGISLTFEDCKWNGSVLNVEGGNLGHVSLSGEQCQNIRAANASFKSLKLRNDKTSMHTGPLTLLLASATVEGPVKVHLYVETIEIASEIAVNADWAFLEHDLSFECEFTRARLAHVAMNLRGAAIDGSVWFRCTDSSSEPRSVDAEFMAADCRIQKDLNFGGVSFKKSVTDLKLTMLQVENLAFNDMIAGDLGVPKSSSDLESTDKDADEPKDIGSARMALTGFRCREARVFLRQDDKGKSRSTAKEFWTAFADRNLFEPVAFRRMLAGALARGGNLSLAEEMNSEHLKGQLKNDKDQLYGPNRGALARKFAEWMPIWAFVLTLAIWHASKLETLWWGLPTGLLLVGAFAYLMIIRGPQNTPLAFELAFRSGMRSTVKSGVKPLSSLAALAFLWLLSSVFYGIAAYTGHIAPIQPFVHMKEKGMTTGDKLGQLAWEAWRLREEEASKDKHYAHRNGFHLSQCLSDNTNVKPLQSLPPTILFSGCNRNWARPDQLSYETHFQSQTGAFLDFAKTNTHDTWLKDVEPDRVHSAGEDLDLPCLCAAFMPTEHSEFNPLLYSLDVTFPLVNLRQEAEWGPRNVITNLKDAEFYGIWGALLVAWQSLHVLLGWILLLILAGSITGLTDNSRRPQ